MELAVLKKLVSGRYPAIRSRLELSPIMGPGTKVFPPTCAGEDSRPVYCEEGRPVDGRKVQTVRNRGKR